MVRALKEIWRALKPGGALFDLRPFGETYPLAVVAEGEATPAGDVDASGGYAQDLAASESVAQVTNEGWFVHERQGAFECFSYWDSADEMQAYVEENWAGEAVVPEAVMAEARRLEARAGAGAKMRIRLPMIIGRYRKVSASG